MCIEVYARLHRCNRISTFGADPGGNEQSEGEYGSVTRTDLVKPELHHLSWATPGTLVVCIIQVQTPALRGNRAASRPFHHFGDSEARKSKAPQWRAVMPVETGEKVVIFARATFPKIRPQVGRKKRLSVVGCFSPKSRPLPFRVCPTQGT